jgi:hypothetical protein
MQRQLLSSLITHIAYKSTMQLSTHPPTASAVQCTLSDLIPSQSHTHSQKQKLITLNTGAHIAMEVESTTANKDTASASPFGKIICRGTVRLGATAFALDPLRAASWHSTNVGPIHLALQAHFRLVRLACRRLLQRPLHFPLRPSPTLYRCRLIPHCHRCIP